MEIEITNATPDVLTAYGEVPIAFEVASRLRVELASGGLSGFRFVEERVVPPFVKDYDALAREGPAAWARRWDLVNWTVLAARDGGRRVGGAVLARKTDGVDMLRGRDDLAVLWDIRVHPKHRGRGIGRRLFARAAALARKQGCLRVSVETQNINVPACRFYRSQGCVLGAIDRHAYPDHPDEVMLLWSLGL